MGLKEDLTAEVKATFIKQWAEEAAQVVPEPEDLRLNSNHAKTLEGTVLYADLDGSTNMVDKQTWSFSAEVYKTYLRCASQIIKSEGGSITAYDGDRVMAIFVGTVKNTTAVRTALKINFAVEQIIRPAYAFYRHPDFMLKHVIGIDTSTLRAARIGVHGDNDLVWIGHAANHAAKLCNLAEKPIWITKAVHDAMLDSVKYHNGVTMWNRRSWAPMQNMTIYETTYHWTL
jgi:class 3 adenylate cyclase